MDATHLQHILEQGEGISTEFKESHTALNKDVFSSVCAFLNRLGGHLVLGVKDDGTPIGIDPGEISTIKNNLVTLSANPQKLNPPFTLFPELVTYQRKALIYVYVPQSSQVHETKGVIYDRSEDGDFRVTNQEHIAQLYLRKKGFYTENKIFPFLRFEDFKLALLPKVRALVRNNRPDHPWLNMSDEELLRSAGLWRRDFMEGHEGYSLAAALLFGKDDVIQQILPHYKIDALLRIENTDRYDDRDDIRTNLIEAYERLMYFSQKHLPDPFYLENDQRISLRDKIFREVIANLLVHREYTHAFPAKFIIEKDLVKVENANKAVGNGPIDPRHFSPYPKNPVIMNFFKELGRVDELGSGIRNVSKYLPHYAPGRQAQFIEGDIFQTVVPYPSSHIERVHQVDKLYSIIHDAISDAVNDAVKSRLTRELKLIIERGGISLTELKERFAIERATAQRDMKLLKDAGFITFSGAPKTGKYQLTNQGKKRLELD